MYRVVHIIREHVLIGQRVSGGSVRRQRHVLRGGGVQSGRFNYLI